MTPEKINISQKELDNNNLTIEVNKVLQDTLLTKNEREFLHDHLIEKRKGVYNVSKESLTYLREKIGSNSEKSWITDKDMRKLKKYTGDVSEGNNIQLKGISDYFGSKNITDNGVLTGVKKVRLDNLIFPKNISKFSIFSKTSGMTTNALWSFSKNTWVDQNNVNKRIKIYDGDVLGDVDIETELNQKLSSEDEYREKYSEFVDYLENALYLPSGIINSLINEESTFGMNLNSETGAKGIMQLTKWPFKDMKGEASDGKIYTSKIKSYLDIFNKIDISKMKTMKISKNLTIGNTLNEDIWSKLEKLTNVNIPIKEATIIINDFQNLIKNKKYTNIYFHTLNIIIGSVYYRKMFDKNNGSLELAAVDYNGDNKKGYKYIYGAKVIGHYKEENA